MDLDYQKLKFKCGLEVHQQLNTKKLFCSCPSVLRSDEPDFTVRRKLHAVAGESGEIDAAAKYQASLNKTFVYQGHDENVCLIDLDEEPPHQINQDSLKIALQIALLLNCKIMPITQIMRKTVVDGSNTAGFQRTTLIARDGFVETAQGKVGIDTICLEEDSARTVSKSEKEVVYNLDRLGIPLVEIATSPDIKSPEQAKEVALQIGDILRSCDVKRGIGTIRQDVNLSILEGNRIEMKGVQDMKIFVKTIENEISRQKKLHDAGKPTQAEVRNALPNGNSEFLRPMPGAARMYPETDLPLLKIGRSMIDGIKKNLPKLSSELAEELKRYGLHEEMIKLILGTGKVDEFKELTSMNRNPELVAKTLVLYPKEIASRNNLSEGQADEIFNRDVLAEALKAVSSKKITERQVKEVLERVASGAEIKDALEFEEQDFSEIEERVVKLLKEKPGLSDNAYMGLLMKEFKGKADAKTLIELIQKLRK